MSIDRYRQIHLAMAEALDAWRIVPRALAGLYCYMLYKVIVWYMALEPYMLEGCKSQNVIDCIVQAPTTSHSILISVIVGVAGAFFGLYTTSGRKWNGFTFWKKNAPENLSKDSENPPV